MIVFKSKDDIPPLTIPTKKYLENYCGQTEDLCYILCPGSSLNHIKTGPNVSGKKISDVGTLGSLLSVQYVKQFSSPILSSYCTLNRDL